MTFADIQTQVQLLTSTNGTSDLPAAVLTALVKGATSRVTSLIERSDGRWQYDDLNYSDLPIATTALVANQQDYAISTTHIGIIRVELLDSSSNWNKLQPIDQADIYNQSLTDFLKTAGTPMYYDKIGNSIFLYPKPSYSQAASLKVYFQRGPLFFDYTTGKFDDATGSTSSTPGFNVLYHPLVSYWSAYEFAVANGKSNAQGLMQSIQLQEDALREDYALRAHDDPIQLRARPKSFR